MLLWQKFLIEWPVQFGRQLWANRRAPLPVLFEKITWRKVVFVVALLLAVAAFAQIVSLDLAFFAAGDVALYCEIAGAVMFVVVRGHVRQSVHTAKLALTRAMHRGRAWCRRCTSARRRRTIKVPAARDKGADDDGGWLPKLPQFAFPA